MPGTSPSGRSLQELHADIQSQITSCDMIIASKDKLIHEIKRELKRKDDEFVKILKQEAEDVDLLLETMADQMKRMSTSCRYAHSGSPCIYGSSVPPRPSAHLHHAAHAVLIFLPRGMHSLIVSPFQTSRTPCQRLLSLLQQRCACRDELEEIERAYLHERRLHLDANAAEVKQLFEKRSDREQAFMERYLALVANYQQQLFDLQVCLTLSSLPCTEIVLFASVHTLRGLAQHSHLNCSHWSGN